MFGCEAAKVRTGPADCLLPPTPLPSDSAGSPATAARVATRVATYGGPKPRAAGLGSSGWQAGGSWQCQGGAPMLRALFGKDCLTTVSRAPRLLALVDASTA